MTARRPSPAKLIRAARLNGLTVTGVEQAPDGSIRVLTAECVSSGDSELARARADRLARKADRAAHRN